MSPRPKSGPRPQRVEVGEAVTALLDRVSAELGGIAQAGAELLRPTLQRYTLELLDLVGVDSGAVLARSELTPKAARKRLRKPGHGEDV